MRKLSMDELGRITAPAYQKGGKWPVRIILDNIRSLHNIGSVFRTADAFRVESISLCGICATPPNREIHKTALGATESVPWKYFEHTSEAVNQARKEGFRIILIEQTDESSDLSDFKYDGTPVALVFGNEIHGVSDEVLPLADLALEIPQFGTKHSFNISVSAGIVLYRLFLLSRPAGGLIT